MNGQLRAQLRYLRYMFNGAVGGPQGLSGYFGADTSLLPSPGIEAPFFSHPAYCLVA